MRVTESYFSFSQSCSPFYVNVSRKKTLCHVCVPCFDPSMALKCCYSKSSGGLLQVPLWGWDVVLSDFNNPICSERAKTSGFPGILAGEEIEAETWKMLAL